jgi:hypothetical protein
LDIRNSFILNPLTKNSELNDEETLKYHFIEICKKVNLIAKRDILGKESVEYYKYKILLNLEQNK